MATKFYIKKNDTNEPLKLVIRKRQDTNSDGTQPEDSYWLTSQSIQQVYFSMAKVPQILNETQTLYPDGTIHNSDGTIVNPPGNQEVLISNIRLQPGEILNSDYSVTQTDNNIRYPSGLIVNPTTNQTTLPDNSVLLPNGMIRLPANSSYPMGYIYNPGDIDRTNYYLVPNPTQEPRQPNNEVLLPPDTYVNETYDLILPRHTLVLPSNTQIIAANTVLFPTGTTVEESTTINRDNAIILPKVTTIYPSQYSLTYDSQTRIYTFPTGTTIIPETGTTPRKIRFPAGEEIEVPLTTFEYAPNKIIFPHPTEHIFATKTLIFPGQIITLPLSASINETPSQVSVTFTTNTIISTNPITSKVEVLLEEQPTLYSNGQLLQYDSTTVTLNDNREILYNGFEIYPRGTQKNSSGTIIHPEGYLDEPSPSTYIRYYPIPEHPDGLRIRPSDGAIVNSDGTFTKLDNSIVDQNNNIIQLPNTNIPYYESTQNPPLIPVTTQSTFLVINQATASHQQIYIPITTQSNQQATLLSYQWKNGDTSHEGLYAGEFTIVNQDSTKRTFPILKDDVLFIEVLEHFNETAILENQ